MSGESLVGLLDQMFAVSVQHGAQVHRKLMSGLHVKVAVRGDRRMIIVWRGGGKLPSGKECEVVGEDAGFYDPKYRLWKCKESDEAFLITEGYRGPLCDHEWGFKVAVDSDKAVGHYTTCLKCGVKLQVLTPRRGKKPKYGYGKWELREHVFERWSVRGPAGDDLAEQPHHQDEASTAPPVVEPLLPPPLTEEAAKRLRDEAEKAKLVGLLTCIAFRSACVDPWFRRHEVIRNRLNYLKNSKLDELREECRGRWFRSHFWHSVPYVLLLCRWPLMTRALPAQATPAPKARKPRKKAVAA